MDHVLQDAASLGTCSLIRRSVFEADDANQSDFEERSAMDLTRVLGLRLVNEQQNGDTDLRAVHQGRLQVIESSSIAKGPALCGSAGDDRRGVQSKGAKSVRLIGRGGSGGEGFLPDKLAAICIERAGVAVVVI
jgi:hypothetical protein